MKITTNKEYYKYYNKLCHTHDQKEEIQHRILLQKLLNLKKL